MKQLIVWQDLNDHTLTIEDITVQCKNKKDADYLHKVLNEQGARLKALEKLCARFEQYMALAPIVPDWVDRGSF